MVRSLRALESWYNFGSKLILTILHRAFWILLWLDGGCFLILIFTMPESSSATILTRRAQRLRKLTGNKDLKSQGEISSEQMAVKQIVSWR